MLYSHSANIMYIETFIVFSTYWSNIKKMWTFGKSLEIKSLPMMEISIVLIRTGCRLVLYSAINKGQYGHQSCCLYLILYKHVIKFEISNAPTPNPYNAELLFTKPWRPKIVFLFKIIINVLVSSFWFIWIPMLWIYGHYKYFNSFSVFTRQNLMSADVRSSWPIKTVPAPKGLFILPWPNCKSVKYFQNK